MIYADTSCLLKVLRPEPLSQAVWSAINEEDSLIVSVLAKLETLVQLKADWTRGLLTRIQCRQAEARFGRSEEPTALRISRFAASAISNGIAPAPEFRRQILPLSGSFAPGCDGRIEGFTFDDS